MTGKDVTDTFSANNFLLSPNTLFGTDYTWTSTHMVHPTICFRKFEPQGLHGPLMDPRVKQSKSPKIFTATRYLFSVVEVYFKCSKLVFEIYRIEVTVDSEIEVSLGKNVTDHYLDCFFASERYSRFYIQTWDLFILIRV